MIRYFLQGRFGPWYEVELSQWEELGLSAWQSEEDSFDEYALLGPIRAVFVNTATAIQEDVKAAFPGLQKLIWFPDMRCGDCNGRLIDENSFDPDMKYPRYVHATGMMDRHGAWPVEEWED